MAVSAIAALASTVSYTAAAGFAFAGWSTFALNFALGAALKALSLNLLLVELTVDTKLTLVVQH